MFENLPQVGIIAGVVVLAVIVIAIITLSRLMVIVPPNMAAAA